MVCRRARQRGPAVTSTRGDGKLIHEHTRDNKGVNTVFVRTYYLFMTYFRDHMLISFGILHAIVLQVSEMKRKSRAAGDAWRTIREVAQRG